MTASHPATRFVASKRLDDGECGRGAERRTLPAGASSAAGPVCTQAIFIRLEDDRPPVHDDGRIEIDPTADRVTLRTAEPLARALAGDAVLILRDGTLGWRVVTVAHGSLAAGELAILFGFDDLFTASFGTPRAKPESWSRLAHAELAEALAIAAI